MPCAGECLCAVCSGSAGHPAGVVGLVFVVLCSSPFSGMVVHTWAVVWVFGLVGSNRTDTGLWAAGGCMREMWRVCLVVLLCLASSSNLPLVASSSPNLLV